jgi:hypothetical protein
MQQMRIPVSPVANVSVISTEKGPHRRTFFQFLYGFGVDTESLKHDAGPTAVSICESGCAKIVILSLIVNDFRFNLLPIFHPLAVKFVLIDNKI